jgi:hypothetical protein
MSDTNFFRELGKFLFYLLITTAIALFFDARGEWNMWLYMAGAIVGILGATIFNE